MSQLSAPKPPLQTVFKIVAASPGASGNEPNTRCVQRTGTTASLLSSIAHGYRQGTCHEAGGFSRVDASRSIWTKKN